MKKKITAALLAAVMVFSMAACGSDAPAAPPDETAPASAPVPTSTPKPTPEPTPAPAPATTTMTEGEFAELLSSLPLVVTYTGYIVQDDQYKALYPDMLQAMLQNNTDADIKDAVVAFAAWDSNSLPVKIRQSLRSSGGAYIQEVNYDDINLIPGGTFGDGYGFSVNEDCGIENCVAIAVSFTTFEGDTWENPYYDEWRTLYEGVKYSDSLSVDVAVEEDTGFELSDEPAAKPSESSLSEEELNEQLSAQEVRIIDSNYIVQDDQYKALYPDMLQVTLQNGTDKDIKDAVVAFVAWDAAGLPVKIRASLKSSGGAYIQHVDYDDINLSAGSTFGENSGFSVDEGCGIETFKAIIVSYETFEGETWDNPLYKDWCALYEGVKLT